MMMAQTTTMRNTAYISNLVWTAGLAVTCLPQMCEFKDINLIGSV